MNPRISHALSRISNTYDDDDATSGVEELVRHGRESVGPLAGLLTFAALTEANANCDTGERVYYLLKALRLIGDPAALEPALRFYVEIDDAVTRTGRTHDERHLIQVIGFAKALAPERAASLPTLTYDDVSDRRDEARSAVDALLA
ncbi:hypothetical protein OV079_12605 [Nannocystis pusilla]|uniref:Uncharacterized protein n=1 Tax=Nannocystis pusilla TaxID=889268 RepID=A0A9X3IWF4_9BACT|nr:hypothetical protein [Nannocystis pusilla]MCY1006386.1 hypothetical protein [Nannocystis pusilla]